MAALPRVHSVFGASTSFAQYRTLTALRIRTITREIPFWAIVGLLVGFSILNGHYAGQSGDQNVWPVTYLMLGVVEGSAFIFLIIVGTLYAAELLWRERDNKFDGIHDALPMHETVGWLSKFTAIAFIDVVMLLVTMIISILMQTIAGFYRYDLLQYVQELFFIVLPQVLGLAVLAMFVQTLVSNKFIGHGIVIGLLILNPILFNWGFENSLYLVGGTPPYISPT